MPIYGHNRIYIKEDYKFAKGGVCGTRGRMVYSLLNRVDDAGYTEVTYACGRNDVDLALVAQGCADFGFKCDIFTPNGDETPMMGAMAVLNKNLHYHQVANGYNNVINARAREYADMDSNRIMLPMGFAARCAVETVMHQCFLVPQDIKRIVVYDESGVIVAGICHGLSFYNRPDVEVIGVTAKREPYNAVARLLGNGLFDRPQVTFTYKRIKQTTSTEDVVYEDIPMLAQSDAHCIKFLESGDMLWCCGDKLG